MVGDRGDERGQQIPVGAMQFEHIEAGARGAGRCAREVVADLDHVGARHGARRLSGFRPGNRRRRKQIPIAAGQPCIHVLPAELGRAFGAGMAKLHRDLGAAFGMHKLDDAFPCRFVRVDVKAGAAGGDARVRRHTGHFGDDQPRAALGALGIVDEVPFAGQAIHGAILRHRGDDDAIGQLHLAQTKRHEHRRARGCWRLACGAGIEPRLRAFEPGLVALPQVFVTDALRAGEQGIVELNGVEMQIALDILKPFSGVARGILQLEHFETAVGLVAREGLRQRRFALQIIGQRDGTFERQLGAGADRKMRGGRSISHQHDVAVRPALAEHAIEIEPGGAAQMTRIRHERMAAERSREDFLAGGDSVLGRQSIEAETEPG